LTKKSKSIPELANNLVDPAVFYRDHRRDGAESRTRALSAWVNNGFQWKKVLESGVIAQRTLYNYLKEPIFIEQMRKLGPLAKQVAVDTYFAAAAEADWANRIKASDRIAQYYDSDWDPGVRRERERSRGNAANTVLKHTLTRDDVREIRTLDPFFIETADNNNNNYQTDTDALEPPSEPVEVLDESEEQIETV